MIINLHIFTRISFHQLNLLSSPLPTSEKWWNTFSFFKYEHLICSNTHVRGMGGMSTGVMTVYFSGYGIKNNQMHDIPQVWSQFAHCSWFLCWFDVVYIPGSLSYIPAYRDISVLQCGSYTDDKQWNAMLISFNL